MKGSYRKIKEGDVTIIDPVKKTLSLACCDCGLVHRMTLAIAGDGKIIIIFGDDKRATAQLRRHNYGYLQQGGSGMYKMGKRDGSIISGEEFKDIKEDILL